MSRTYKSSNYKRSNYYDFNPYDNDKKPWFKPNKKFKTMEKRIRKAKEKQALKLEKEIIPDFPKTDVWYWT